MWTQRQARDFVKEVRARVGNGWQWLTPDVRHALVAERAFAVARGQVAESVSVDAMNRLYVDMLRIAGGGQ